MKNELEKLLDQMIRRYGFEHPYVIYFARKVDEYAEGQDNLALDLIATYEFFMREM